MKHTLWCRVIMAMAHRRMCTCGASPPRSRDHAYRDAIRLRDKQLRGRKRQRAPKRP